MTIKYCLIIAQVGGRWATLGYRRSIWAQIGNFPRFRRLGLGSFTTRGKASSSSAVSRFKGARIAARWHVNN